MAKKTKPIPVKKKRAPKAKPITAASSPAPKTFNKPDVAGAAAHFAAIKAEAMAAAPPSLIPTKPPTVFDDEPETSLATPRPKRSSTRSSRATSPAPIHATSGVDKFGYPPMRQSPVGLPSNERKPPPGGIDPNDVEISRDRFEPGEELVDPRKVAGEDSARPALPITKKRVADIKATSGKRHRHRVHIDEAQTKKIKAEKGKLHRAKH